MGLILLAGTQRVTCQIRWLLAQVPLYCKGYTVSNVEHAIVSVFVLLISLFSYFSQTTNLKTTVAQVPLHDLHIMQTSEALCVLSCAVMVVFLLFKGLTD